MKLSRDMNFIDISKYIRKQQADGVDRDTIEAAMIKAFDWSTFQAALATNPFYTEKRPDSALERTRTKRK